MQISALDLMNIDTLEDQLIGVDSLYFMRLIEQFRRMKEKNADWDLTPQYIISVIDKIF
jgi:aryl carrier-like protein